MEIELTVLNSLKIYQPKKGYRFAAEPFILIINLQLKDDSVLLDYGSGCGIISILASNINRNCTIYSLESNPEMREIIKNNIGLNGAYNVNIIDDINNLSANSVDMVLSNPPYFLDGFYRKSENFYKEKFESIGIDAMIAEIKRVIKNKGIFKMSYHPTRLIQLSKQLESNGFGIKYLTPVYGNRNKMASFLIVESKFATKTHTIFKKAIYLEELEYF